MPGELRREEVIVEFKGIPVVIVGAHASSGPSIVKAFVEQGARVAVGVTASSGKLRVPLPGAVELELDTSDAASIGKFFDQCEEALGGVQVLVNVAPRLPLAMPSISLPPTIVGRLSRS